MPAWVGDHLYFLCADHGAAHIWRVPTSGGEPEQITSGGHAISRWDIDHAGTMLVYTASNPTSPGEIYRQRLDAPASQTAQLTALNQPILQDIHLGDIEEFWLPAHEAADDEIQGWILKPPGFDPGATYPLLLEIHGGPAASYGLSWFHEFQYLAAQGYVIVFANPRGSQGYGERFSTAIYQGWGPRPLADLLNAVDHVIAQGSVDPNRLYSIVHRQQFTRMLARPLTLPPAYQAPRVIHLVTEYADEPMVQQARALRTQGVLFSLEPLIDYRAWTNREEIVALLPQVDLVTPDWPSASGIAGSTEPRQVVDYWARLGPRVVAIRHGHHGSYVWDGDHDRCWHIPTVPVPVRDPTGAGNGYGGGLCAGWIATGEAHAAGTHGAVAASFMVERVGLPALSERLQATARDQLKAALPAASPFP